ncbi:MAG: hypothetical protein K0U93_19765 [Gammaproteobacteria bacterium]|nr:hypothetical protein [Gammaproteobacteria bacterium]
MAHYDRERERRHMEAPMRARIEDEPGGSVTEGLGRMVGLAAAILGFVVMIAGVVFGLLVLTEAWALYKEPARIERIARAVEKGSNIDQALSSAVAKPADANAQPGGSSVKVSYMLAWFIAPALMFVCGALSFWAVTAGGNLALKGLQSRRAAT